MIATFGHNEFKATGEYCGGDMHTVTYTGPDMKELKNFIFNEDREKGEKDSIEMAERFVRTKEATHGK